MSVVFWLIAVVSVVQATSLYDASEGRIGYGFPDIALSPSCFELADASVDTQVSSPKKADSSVRIEAGERTGTKSMDSGWRTCAHDMNELLSSELSPKPVSRQQRMYVVTAFLRAGDIDSAFQTFEPLLQFLQSHTNGENHLKHTSEQAWTDEHWSIVILEAWLLSRVGLDRESLSLVKHVPSTTLDAGGKYIVETNIRHRRYQFRQRNRIWKEGLSSSSIKAWNWWHKAQWETDTQLQLEVMGQAVKAPHSNVIHHQQYIDLLVDTKNWEQAMRSVVDALSLFPESRGLFAKAVAIAQREEGRLLLHDWYTIFPEHTKVLMIIGYCEVLQGRPVDAMNKFLEAEQLGESSTLFRLLKEQVRSLINQD